MEQMEQDLFISASAGTGKTHAISIAYVDLFDRAFQNNDPLDAGNVVAITFTRKAAAQMKSRILDMIRQRETGDPRWQQLKSSMAFAWISTIDSFAARIISEVGIYAGIAPDIQIGSDSRISSILERCILRAFFDHEDLIEPLIQHLTLDDLSLALKKAVKEKRYAMMRSKPAGNAEGGLPLHVDPVVAGAMVLASDALKKLFEKVYRSFLEEMQEENLTDFAGVIVALKDLLSSPDHAWIKERYSRQFKHIIVDEFQDTDSLQKEVMDLLRGEHSHIIYVGDAKQSIYRFRGAEVEVFSQAREEVRSVKGEVRHLERNYRSHPDILKLCNTFYPLVFDSCEKKYSQIYEPVTPLPVVGETGNRPRVKILFDPQDEAEAAAKYILSIVGQQFDFVERRQFDGETKLLARKRVIRFRDIAILLRKMRPDKGKEYTGALARHGIPFYTVGEAGFFEIPEIAGILATLRVLSNPGDEMALTSALMSPVVGLDIQDMARLKFRAKAAGKGIFQILGLIEKSDINPGRIDRLRRFHQVMERYLPIRSMIRPSELAERLVEELDYPAFLAVEDSNGRKSANLRKFIITARSLDEAGVSLRELIRMLNDVGLDDEEQASIESEDTDAVKVMTVHKAKGLEFPVVIVGDTSWSQKEQKELLLFDKGEEGMCFTLNCLDKDQCEGSFLGKLMAEEKDRNYEEEKRSLYVATTRASDMLVLTFTNKKGNTSRPWREMILGSMVQVEGDGEGIALALGFEGLVEIVAAPEATVAQASASPARIALETRYIEPVGSETFKEYISPTAICKTSSPGWRVEIDEGYVVPEEDSGEGDRSLEMGLFAHRVMEAVGNGIRLAELVDGGGCRLARGLRSSELDESQVQVVLGYLGGLKDHPLVKEMEAAQESRNESQIIRPFGKYILSGRPDKMIKTAEGWTILDFKFSSSERHSEAYEFQTRFYLYIAREIFSPMLEAELFYLKDGVSVKVQLGEGDVRDFENDLIRRIEEYQAGISMELQNQK
ncbi:MAG: UvrD-helicase domain-containing protein [Methanosarcinales archaeon]|nr:UvrD-helicase domain-containing protein [Methanosarcinales archaeon]